MLLQAQLDAALVLITSRPSFIGVNVASNPTRSAGPTGASAAANSGGTTISPGNAARGTGLLRNRLYVGELIWNWMRFIRDPSTDRRVSRMNPQLQWVRPPRRCHGRRRPRLPGVRDGPQAGGVQQHAGHPPPGSWTA